MIETEQLSKRYGDLTAVDQLSFQVKPGEVLGFLGPNGAGKSTTMKILSGFLAPTSGTARVCGHDVTEAPVEAKREIGYLPEGAPSYGEMTPASFLEFIADVRGLSGDTRRQRMAETVARLHLDRVLHQRIETLSKGFKRRVGLAQAILHDPAVLILDEPTDGLDPNQKHEVRSLIHDMAADKLVIISTHILEEVDALCSRAIIIARGRILADDTPANLEARSRYHNAVSVRFSSDTGIQEAAKRIESLGGVREVEHDVRDRRLTALTDGSGKALAEISAMANEAGWPVAELKLESGRLDEVFRTITTREAEGALS
ncbi:MAG: ATP-binding cassette domain-containing protein [Pseudomonadota bacterium]